MQNNFLEARVRKDLEEHIALFRQMDRVLLPKILEVGRLLSDQLHQGFKLLVAGNGGSAADAQHFVAELVGRFMKEREALAAIALTTDTSILTAVGNDYGFDQVFSRQVSGLGRPGDVFIAISTSGNSANLVKAIKAAQKKGLKTVALVGKTGGEMATCAEHTVLVPSPCTPRIQEAQEWIWHTWCHLIDQLH